MSDENCGKALITMEACGVCDKCLINITALSGILGYYENKYGDEIKKFQLDAVNESIKKMEKPKRI